MLIHDALLISAPVDKIKTQARQVQEMMAEASRLVLGGFALRTEAKIFEDHYYDERGESTWNLAMRLLKDCRLPQQQYQLFGPNHKTEVVDSYVPIEVEHSYVR